MKKSNIVVSILLVIVILSLIAVIFYNIIDASHGAKESSEATEDVFSVSIRTLPLCVSGVDCGFSDMEFRSLLLQKKNSKLEKVEKEVNSIVEESYQTVLESDVASAECSDVVSLYQHSIFAQNILAYYSDSEIVSVALISSSSNLCNNTILDEKFTVYYYDVSTDKMINQEDLEKKYNIDRESVLQLLRDDLEQHNQIDGTSYSSDTIADFQLYIDYEGEVQAYYRCQDNPLGYTVPIGKNIND